MLPKRRDMYQNVTIGNLNNQMRDLTLRSYALVIALYSDDITYFIEKKVRL